jgi:hypothetical protein
VKKRAPKIWVLNEMLKIFLNDENSSIHENSPNHLVTLMMQALARVICYQTITLASLHIIASFFRALEL